MSGKPLRSYAEVKEPRQPKPRRRPPKINPRTGGHRFKHLVNEPLREFVRGLDCVLAGKPGCRGATEAAHVRARGAGGEDFDNLVALCQAHHRELHFVGRRTFEYQHKLRLKVYARATTARWLKLQRSRA